MNIVEKAIITNLEDERKVNTIEIDKLTKKVHELECKLIDIQDTTNTLNDRILDDFNCPHALRRDLLYFLSSIKNATEACTTEKNIIELHRTNELLRDKLDTVFRYIEELELKEKIKKVIKWI